MEVVPYWPFYCEENVWQRCRVAEHPAFAVFVSNPARQVLMCAQASGEGPFRALVWDYHVFVIEVRPDGVRVADPDHADGVCSPLDEYLSRSFVPLDAANERLAPQFRVVDGARYVSRFASDRHHMRKPDGGWLHPPPPWPAIGEGSNLACFIDTQSRFEGETGNLDWLVTRFLADPGDV